MKYIKTYESFVNMDYLSNQKKYILIKSRNDEFLGHIIENVGDQFKKLYDIYKDGRIYSLKLDWHFVYPYEEFKQNFEYESDNLDDVLEYVDTFIVSSKYNL